MMWDGVFSVSRWLVGVGLLGLAWHWGTTEQEPINVMRLLLAAFTFFAGVAVMWKPIFYFATRPFLAVIDGIFLPGGRLEKPVLNLKLPAHYLDEARYEEALEEYRQILKHYPDETEAYEKSIWLEAAVFKRPVAARALLKRAKRRRLVLDPMMVSLAETRARG
jgi:tetratricopeptide (TPR) repeat protein